MSMMKKYSVVVYIALACMGLWVRFWLATTSYNVDIENYIKDVRIFHSQGNIYTEQAAYNYTPIWFYVLGGVDIVRSIIVPNMTFATAIRIFLSLVDVVILIVLFGLCLKKKIPMYTPLLYFFLNPVSIIISAKHGQFDNVAILFLVLAWYASERKAYMVTWLLGAVALIIKHIVLFPLLILYWSIWGIRKGSIAIFFAILAFFVTFIPYVEAWREILSHVVFYGGIPGQYGISYILTQCYMFITQTSTLTMQSSVGGATGGVRIVYILLTALTLLINMAISFFLSKNTDTWKAMGYSFVFFLATTTGISAQYFILPVVFMGFDSKKWLIIYTLIVTLFLLGTPDEFGLRTFHVWSWNVVWIVIVVWSLFLIQALRRNMYSTKHPSR